VRKAVVALLSALVAGLMMVPGVVSAGTTSIVVADMSGDLGPKYDRDTLETVVTWPETRPIVEAGYFDMLSWSFSYSSKSKTYTFEMEVSKALPSPGSPLPNGYKEVRWQVWLDMEPWHPNYNPTAGTYYTARLIYDGSDYAAEIAKGGSWGPTIATVPFKVDGSHLQIQFSAGTIGNLKSFWVMPCTVVLWSLIPYSGYWDLDSTDPGAAPGQVWWDVPWPPA